jgi:YD repeat-containing protein
VTGLFGLPGIAHAQSGSVGYVYDSLGRVIAAYDPSGNAAAYTYDAVGNLLSITNYPSTQFGGVGLSFKFRPNRFDADYLRHRLLFKPDGDDQWHERDRRFINFYSDRRDLAQWRYLRGRRSDLWLEPDHRWHVYGWVFRSINKQFHTDHRDSGHSSDRKREQFSGGG